MPELEAVEVNVTNIFFDRDVMTSLSSKKVPDSLKTMIEGLRKMEEEGDDEVDLARPKSGAREPKEEFPRPLSQVKPLILPPQVIDAVFISYIHSCFSWFVTRRITSQISCLFTVCIIGFVSI